MNKKILWSVITVTTVAFLTGCAPKPKEETTLDVDKLLENQVMAPTDATMNQMAPGMDATMTQTMDATSTQMMDAASPSTNPSTKDIQQALKNAGLYQGKVDGDIGPRTKKAIKDFQAQNSLAADGKVGPKTWAKLSPYLSQAAADTTATTEISN